MCIRDSNILDKVLPDSCTVLIVSFDISTKLRFIIPSILFACLTAAVGLHCFFHFKIITDNIISKFLSSLTTCSWVASIAELAELTLEVLYPRCMTLHFLTLNNICHSLDYISHKSARSLSIPPLSGPVGLSPRYTTPDIHCRDKRYEWDVE